MVAGLPVLPTELLLPGAYFHQHYEVKRRIGAGGMGVVYEVHDRRTQRRRALKVLRTDGAPDLDQIARFQREATVTAPISSPHLVEVLDAGLDEASGLPFLVMELLEGADLGARSKAQRFTASEVVTVLEVIGRALDELHSHDIVHRDLKPENLFLARDAGTEVLKILDFGAAKILSASMKTTRALGSPLYMSPEAIEGEGTLDGRADVYAMGHIAFTLLVGEAFWESTWRESRGYYGVLLRMMRGKAVAASVHAARLGATLPPGFDSWFARSTARSVGSRFETAGDCAAEFARLVRAGPQSQRRHWWWIVGAASAALIIALGLGSLKSAAHLGPASTSSDPVLSDAPRAVQTLREAQTVVAASSTIEATGRPTSTSDTGASIATAARPRGPGRRAGAPASAQPSAAPTALRPTVDYTRIR